MRILVREETPTGPKIEELLQSECNRVSPACQNIGDEVYQGASLDQTRVYFLSNRQLTNSDLDGTSASCDNESAVAGCDLYLYDSTRPAGERLIQVSAGDATDPTPGIGANLTNSITAISADGSHVYFVARSILTTKPNAAGATAQAGAKNLFAYSYPSEKLAFIGKLDEEDGGGPFPKFALFGASDTWANDAYPVPIEGTDSKGNQVAGDGHTLVFRTKARLTADDTDEARDIYRYNADTGELTRISAGLGGSGNANIDVEKSESGSFGTDYAERGRWVSEDGETIVFTTAEGLLPGDVNGLQDVYMWRHGQLYELPGGTQFNSILRPNSPSMSHDGSVIAYHSSVQLLPSDGDSVQDVYVARVDGGFPTGGETDCTGEACQGAPATVSGETGAASATFDGAGNVQPKKRSPHKKTCPPGKRKVKRNGKVRCVPRHDAGKSHGHRAGGHRRAGK
jgi:Tol biopolymer transport system component